MPVDTSKRGREVSSAVETSLPTAPPGVVTEPVSASRRALLVGGLVAAGGAAVAASRAQSQATPDPMAGHAMPGGAVDPYSAHDSGMAHGNMTMVGQVDHARNGFDPTAMLTDWETGQTEVLPDGRTLRTFEVDAIDVEIEIAPGVFFPAWTFNGRVPGPALRAKEGERLRIIFRNLGSHPHSMHFHGIHSACRVALKSETRRVRGYFLPLIMRFHCHRAYAFRALPGDVIDRGKQTWLLIEGAQ